MTSVFGRWLWGAVGVLALAAPSAARTIVLTDEDCDQMAAIAVEAPRLSWATYQSSAGVFTTFVFLLTKDRAVLLRYPLDKIPKGQRITSAELVFPLNYFAGAPRMELRRLVADWGAGVCYKYRRTHPRKVPWTRAGARGVSSDVALKPSGELKVAAIGNQTINVTEDVELWYSGGAVNRGWSLFTTDGGSTVQLPSPLSPWVPGKGAWKLRITYEPK